MKAIGIRSRTNELYWSWYAVCQTKTTAVADKAAQPQCPAELLEQLIPGPVTPTELEGIFQQFKKAVLERALGAEMSHHLGYAPGQAKPEGAAANHRNGKSTKTVLTDTGALRIDVPRDREGTFEPQLIGKHERRFTGFDDKIVAMYGSGHQADLHGGECRGR